MSQPLKSFPLEGKAGLSDKQLQLHRDVLYKGYVTRLGEIETQLGLVDRTTANAVSSPFRALKVEEIFALNGTVLHELYFGNLTGDAETPGAKATELLTRDFGSVDAWQADFLATAKAARGWAVLAYSLYDGKIHNYLLDAHHLNVPALAVPLLVIDVYEHAYFVDYGTDRATYLADSLAHVSWTTVEKRLNWCAGFGAAQDSLV